MVLACLGVGAVLIILRLMKTRRAVEGFGPRVTPGKTACELAGELGIRRLVVVDDPRTCCCVCVGLFRPRVIISTGVIAALDEAQLRAVLAHEASHASHRDPLLITLSRAAGAGLFFVPLARGLSRLSLARAEMAADAAAVAVAGRAALCGALLALDKATPAGGAMARVASAEVIDLRIQALKAKSVPRTHELEWLLGAGMVVLVAMSLVVTAWVRPSNDQPPVITQVHTVSPSSPKNPLRVPVP